MPTAIPYLDEAWQPVTGCTPCSPGCVNCYAATMAQTGRLRNHPWYNRLAKSVQGPTGLTVGKWTGEVRCNEDVLTRPLQWKKPRTVGVCFMGDLFHEDVPDAFLDKVFAVMALCQQHTFVTCTKRAERMREYLTGSFADLAHRINDAARELSGKDWIAVYPTQTHGMVPDIGWPPPNCHFGVTVESNEQSGRISDLIATPAAHRWLSVEPMLGPVDLSWLTDRCKSRNPTGDRCSMKAGHGGEHYLLHPTGGWGKDQPCESLITTVAVGCESGPNRRPFDLDWARQVRDDCQAADVKLYVKQLIVDGRFTKEVAEFPDDLRQQDLSWPIGKRGA